MERKLKHIEKVNQIKYLGAAFNEVKEGNKMDKILLKERDLIINHIIEEKNVTRAAKI